MHACDRVYSQWRPVFRILRMFITNPWSQQIALEGDALQRIAAVRVWLAEFRARMILRHDGGAAIRDAVVAAAAHAKLRIPASVGGASPARLRVHRRVRVRA